MKSFCGTYKRKSFIKQLTCYKNSDIPASIDLVFTNVSQSFQGTCVFETGISD